jgi:hypothetical protein
VRGFFAFWYGFIVGDDWTVAVGVIAALGVTSLLAHTGAPAWWVLPAAVASVLCVSAVRLARRSR